MGLTKIGGGGRINLAKRGDTILPPLLFTDSVIPFGLPIIKLLKEKGDI